MNKPKYKIGDTVWIIVNNNVYKVPVIDVEKTPESTENAAYYSVFVETDADGNSLKFNEEDVFTSDEEALQFIYSDMLNALAKCKEHAMTFKSALTIIDNIMYAKNLTEEQLVIVGEAIKYILEMPTLNYVTKTKLLDVIKFLWNEIFVYEEHITEEKE